MGRRPNSVAKRSGTDRVSAYIRHIGEQEERSGAFDIRRPDAGSPSPHHAAEAVGYSCMLLLAGNDRQANATLRQVRDSMRTIADATSRRFESGKSEGPYLFYLASLLLRRDESGATDVYRAQTHGRTVQDMDRLGRSMRGSGQRRQGDLIGLRNEILMLSVLTRGDSEETLAFRALVHHNITERAHGSSHDLVTVLYGADGSLQPTVSKQQLKDGCLDFEDGKKGDPRGIAIGADYENDITIISGHCDVHGGDPRGVIAALSAENDGKASPIMIAMLDARTQHLTDIITSPEEWRRGAAAIGE